MAGQEAILGQQLLLGKVHSVELIYPERQHPSWKHWKLSWSSYYKEAAHVTNQNEHYVRGLSQLSSGKQSYNTNVKDSIVRQR